MKRERFGPARVGTRMRASLIALGVAIAGCGPGGDDAASGGGGGGEDLLVMAASSLNNAMPALIEAYRARGGGEVTLVLGATGNLAAQIENGAPADLFFAADETTVEMLAERGTIRANSARTYTTGRLALAWGEGVAPPEGVASLAEERFEVVAIANPEVAPYGAAAREALQRSGVWPAVEPRIVYSENVSQAYQLLLTGNADAALVALSVVNPTATGSSVVDQALYTPLRQAAGIVESSTNANTGDFLEFVLSPEGQAILTTHGFAPVSEGP